MLTKHDRTLDDCALKRPGYGLSYAQSIDSNGRLVASIVCPEVAGIVCLLNFHLKVQKFPKSRPLAAKKIDAIRDPLLAVDCALESLDLGLSNA